MTVPPPFRILLVEDNPANVDLFTAILRRDGYVVEVVSDGQDVEARAGAIQPDLVLMDINLPAVDGTELLRRLRNAPATARLRIVAVTAHAMQGDAEGFLAMGFDAYIAKPVDVALFRATVRRLLEEQRPDRH